jgi:hypothetical protein
MKCKIKQVTIQGAQDTPVYSNKTMTCSFNSLLFQSLNAIL